MGHIKDFAGWVAVVCGWITASMPTVHGWTDIAAVMSCFGAASYFVYNVVKTIKEIKRNDNN